MSVWLEVQKKADKLPEDDNQAMFNAILGALSPYDAKLLHSEAILATSLTPQYGWQEGSDEAIEKRIMERFAAEEAARTS